MHEARAPSCSLESLYNLGVVYMKITENEMETTEVYWGCIGITDKNMETTVVYIEGIRQPYPPLYGASGFRAHRVHRPYGAHGFHRNSNPKP